ncbi:hypothetical protein LJB83_01810 [Clostridia bacterium OttesenSCG-928-F22]|nr:hypothetical protein [Clostridia bacterium OttesenSCG-928-F22]
METEEKVNIKGPIIALLVFMSMMWLLLKLADNGSPLPNFEVITAYGWQFPSGANATAPAPSTPHRLYKVDKGYGKVGVMDSDGKTVYAAQYYGVEFIWSAAFDESAQGGDTIYMQKYSGEYRKNKG